MTCQSVPLEHGLPPYDTVLVKWDASFVANPVPVLCTGSAWGADPWAAHWPGREPTAAWTTTLAGAHGPLAHFELRQKNRISTAA